jgi:putative transcriptional regulator
MHTVVETPPYLADAERLFSAEEQAKIVDIVSTDPQCGVVMPGTGGVRKLRVAASGRGKRGGARVIYLFGGEDVPLFLLAVFAKNEKSDLSQAECNSHRQDDGRINTRLSEWTMSKRAFEKIKAGLDSAKAYLDGTADKRNYRVHVPEKIDVRKIRARLGLSQEAFAERYGFALSAIRDWEQGRRRPERSARILLKIVEREPEAVRRALAG